jgi:hypothetical protein
MKLYVLHNLLFLGQGKQGHNGRLDRLGFRAGGGGDKENRVYQGNLVKAKTSEVTLNVGLKETDCKVGRTWNWLGQGSKAGFGISKAG